MQVRDFTKRLMEKFPSWMKMAKDESSVGAQFLDVFGITLEEFKLELDQIVNDFYISTANTEMIDIIYKVPLATTTIDDFSENPEVHILLNDGTQSPVRTSKNLRNFYKYEENILSKAIVDRPSGYLYLRVDLDSIKDIKQPFKAIVINQAPQYEVIIHHVWNAFDEFGYLLGLARLEGERNESFKSRILDVFQNPGNSTHQGIINGVSRELGLSKEDITLFNFNSPAFDEELVNSDGSPTKKMISYAKKVNESLKFTWDTMNFGEAYWHSLEEENLGIYYLPHIWDTDVSIFESEDFQSGVGREDDLRVYAPTVEDSTRKFKAYIGLMGYFEEVEEIFPEISFRYKIFAKGKVPNQEYKEEVFKNTVKATRLVDQQYTVKGEQNFKFDHRTDFFNSNDFKTDSKMNFGKSNDFLHKQTENLIRLSIKMGTKNEIETPSIGEIKVGYEDTSGVERFFLFNTRDHWLTSRKAKSGQPLTNVQFADMSVTDNKLELGFGAFQRILDTTADFQTGTYDSKAILIRNGKLELNRDITGTVMN